MTSTDDTTIIPATPPPKQHHYVRNAAIGFGAILVAAVAFGVAAGAANNGTPQPGPTVTATVTAPAPTVTQTVNVQVTQTATVAPPALTVATYRETGTWNSPQFSVDGSPLTVKFSYWDNTSGYGGDNFIANLIGSSDDLPFANEIGVSGGKTTTLYPSGSGLLHLEVTATGPWAITITQQG